MMQHINAFHQNLGIPVPNWTPKARPSATMIPGRYCTLQRFDSAQHSAGLWQALQENNPGDTWTYLPYGPFASEAELAEAMSNYNQAADTALYTILDAQTQKVLGIAGYLRIQPEHGSIEIGHVHFSKRLQKTPAATEAIFLLLTYAFDTLAYRRCEWKCHSLNAASRKAALRFGFQFEGIFRQACVYKGYNRDTAWYAIIDAEWPLLKARFEAWLSPDNFDANGQQRQALNRIHSNDRQAQGVVLMQHVFGAEATAAVATNLGRISPAFLDFLQGTFGDIYGDNTLDLKTQEIIVLVSLITQKDSKPQLKTHLKAALKTGLSQEEIVALIKHLILYVGFPTAINALLTAQEVFNESAS